MKSGKSGGGGAAKAIGNVGSGNVGPIRRSPFTKSAVAKR